MKLLLLLLGMASMVASATAAEPPEVVVVLHGMGRTRWSMMRIARALEADGYRVVNLSYPSHGRSLESLAGEWLPGQLTAAAVAQAPRVHFLTHSLGGIVVRAWLHQRGAPANLGRVVMLAPPNAGSEIADQLNGFPPYRWFTGVNGRRLGTGPDSAPRALGPWPEAAGKLGIIAGDRSINPLMAALIPGANDGKVSVASTHLAGERDHVTLHHSHTWLGWRADTIAQIKMFLRRGQFG